MLSNIVAKLDPLMDHLCGQHSVTERSIEIAHTRIRCVARSVLLRHLWYKPANSAYTKQCNP
jgi:hypothetical protein